MRDILPPMVRKNPEDASKVLPIGGYIIMVLVRIWVVWVPSPFYGAHSEV